MKKIFTVNSKDTNTRIDRWIKINFYKIPQSLIEKSLRKGKIKVNSRRKKGSYKLILNDKIELFDFNPSINNISKKLKYSATNKEIKSVDNFIIENNNNFVVINKPRNISVQSGTKSRKNILDILNKTHFFKDLHPFTVHRLDKETTGALIVAKNREYARLFTSLFRIRKIQKTYLCITFGRTLTNKGVLKDQLQYFEKGKLITNLAITNFKVIDSNNYYSFLELTPVTGRKHQIRKQLLKYGCPILGDQKYRFSDIKKNKTGMLMLHAYKIQFSLNKKKYEYTANIPLDFKKTLKEKSLKTF